MNYTGRFPSQPRTQDWHRANPLRRTRVGGWVFLPRARTRPLVPPVGLLPWQQEWGILRPTAAALLELRHLRGRGEQGAAAASEGGGGPSGGRGGPSTRRSARSGRAAPSCRRVRRAIQGLLPGGSTSSSQPASFNRPTRVSEALRHRLVFPWGSEGGLLLLSPPPSIDGGGPLPKHVLAYSHAPNFQPTTMRPVEDLVARYPGS